MPRFWPCKLILALLSRVVLLPDLAAIILGMFFGLMLRIPYDGASVVTLIVYALNVVMIKCLFSSPVHSDISGREAGSNSRKYVPADNDLANHFAQLELGEWRIEVTAAKESIDFEVRQWLRPRRELLEGQIGEVRSMNPIRPMIATPISNTKVISRPCSPRYVVQNRPAANRAECVPDLCMISITILAASA